MRRTTTPQDLEADRGWVAGSIERAATRGSLPWRLACVLLSALVLLAAGVPSARAAEVYTPHLAVSDPVNRMPRERLAERAARMEALLMKIAALWEADPAVDRLGKIRVVILPQARELRLSVFHMVRDGSTMVREVLAAPPDGPPQMLVHKLTSALFPSKDKLVRNMMGEVSEERLGNLRAFPRCGLAADAWVLALLRLGKYAPLRGLGPNHDTWGMADGDKGVPMTQDPDLHHRSYVEAASFGVFLFERYGMARLKEFCRQAGDLGRPWEAVYGQGLDTLEAQWLEALRGKEAQLEPDVALAAELYARDPAAACDQCQQARPEK